MRRFICIFFLFIIVPTLALGADLKTMVEGHNDYAMLTGAVELTGKPVEKEGSTSKGYIYHVNGVDVGFIVKEGNVSSCYCIASDENIGEFLSQAASALLNIAGIENVAYCYARLLDQYLMAKIGEESQNYPFIENVVMFYVKKSDGKYTFLAAILK